MPGPLMSDLVDVGDPVGAAAEHDHGRNGPKQDDWHGSSPLDFLGGKTPFRGVRFRPVA
jgi:hypothetical protein